MKLSAQKQYIHLKEPFRVSFGTLSGLDVIEVAVERDGVIGRGECCPMAIYDQTPQSTLAEIDTLAEALSGRAISRADLQSLLPARASRNALDCALWDLEAKSSGRTIWELAERAPVEQISAGISFGIVSPDETAALAERHRGVPRIKLKLGSAFDLECVRAVRSVLPDTSLFVDVNAGWTLDRLNALAPDLADLGVFMIEQPLPADQDHLLADYNRAVPLCADKSCHDRRDLDRLAGHFDYINIKLDKTGGLTEALALADEAQARGFRLMVGCMMGSGLAMAPAYVVASLCEIVDLDVPLLVRDAAFARVRHDGRALHQFDRNLWG